MVDVQILTNNIIMSDELMQMDDGDLAPIRKEEVQLSKLSEVNDIIMSSNNLIKNLNITVTTVCSTIEDIKRISADVELEISRMDHMIDSLMIKANRDIELYKISIPTLNKQFDSVQTRLDTLMGRALDMVSTDFSENALARSEFAMKLIEQVNDTLNRLIEKLIPSY